MSKESRYSFNFRVIYRKNYTLFITNIFIIMYENRQVLQDFKAIAFMPFDAVFSFSALFKTSTIQQTIFIFYNFS